MTETQIDAMLDEAADLAATKDGLANTIAEWLCRHYNGEDASEITDEIVGGVSRLRMAPRPVEEIIRRPPMPEQPIPTVGPKFLRALWLGAIVTATTATIIVVIWLAVAATPSEQFMAAPGEDVCMTKGC